MTKRRLRKAQCANTRLSVDLTQDLLERINRLSPSVKTDYLKREILSKFVSSETDSPDIRRERAITKWLSTEALNERTNDRLISANERDPISSRMFFGPFVEKCRSIIAEIIGDTVPLEGLIGSFSGGASTSRNRTESHPALKYLGQAHVTPRCLEIWEDIVRPELEGWQREGLDFACEIVPGNVLFTVPKKTDIDRVACKEPDVNMFIQKGLGDHLRKCLRSIGINLNDQSINWKLARVGSITNELATLDLSSASDSVSRELVALLMPVSWYTLLDSVRSPITLIGGLSAFGDVEHRNHMFSSMGNGFTFELESLLFYALARTTAFFTGTRGVISVYGDDIICPSRMYEDLTQVLSYFGFQVNTEKSFKDGPFRESCGGHFHDGCDITPFYVRKPIETLIDIIHVANQLREWASLGSGFSILNPEVEPIWLWLKSLVPCNLWGGGDTSFKYQLVSLDAPSMRLSEETTRSSTGDGGYYHWLNATWARTKMTDGVATSRKTNGAGRFRLRKVRDTAVPRLPAVFLVEIA